MTQKIKDKIIAEASGYFVPYGIPMRKYDVVEFDYCVGRGNIYITWEHRITKARLECGPIYFTDKGEIHQCVISFGYLGKIH